MRLFLALVLSSLQPALAESPETLRNLDVFELEVASDPQISPDGRQIAYVRQSMDIMTDRARSNIWLVSDDGRSHRPLLSGVGTYSSPRWSPTGDRLAYLSSVDGRGAELHLRWMDTGQTALLSNLPESPGAISWSPDGRLLAFSMLVTSDGPKLAKSPAKPEGAEWAPPVTVIDSLQYRGDGRGYLKTGYRQLFVMPADGGTPRRLTSGDFNHDGPLSWSGDGSQLYFSTNRNADWQYQPLESEVWSLALASGEMRQLTEREGPDFAPTVAPDGRHIAYLGFDDRKMGYHNVGVYLMDRDGGNRRALLPDDFDRSIAAVEWVGRDRLVVQFDDRGKRQLASLTTGGRLQVLTDQVGGTSLGRPYTSGGFSVAANGAVAFSAGQVDRPADVGLVERPGRATTLTRLNDDLLNHRRLAEIEELIWTSSADGLEVQGWLAKPPDFDPAKKYPLILEIHGGPFAAYGPHFSTEVQLYAAAGYVVLYANPRGSTSYGDQFANYIHHNYPSQDYDDLMSGVDAVIERGLVDAEQLFVTGGSGGGVLTAWIVGKTDRFKAAVVAKPVINWISTVLTTDIAVFMPQYWFAQPPWEDVDSYWERSPLSLVGNVTTPTMLLTGEQDHRTPITESEQYYQALKLRQVDTAMVRVPEASHGIAARPSHLIAKVDNILAWFERYRGPASGEDATDL